MSDSALGWAIVIGTVAIVFLGGSAARGLDWVEDDWMPVALLTFVYMIGSTVGLTIAFGSLGEGIGSTLVSLVLIVPTLYHTVKTTE